MTTLVLLLNMASVIKERALTRPLYSPSNGIFKPTRVPLTSSSFEKVGLFLQFAGYIVTLSYTLLSAVGLKAGR